MLVRMAHVLRKLGVNRHVARTCRTVERSGEQRSCTLDDVEFEAEVHTEVLECRAHLGLVADRRCTIECRSGGLVRHRRGVLRCGFHHRPSAAFGCYFKCHPATRSACRKQDVGCDLRDSINDLKGKAELITHQAGVFRAVVAVFANRGEDARRGFRAKKRTNTQWDSGDQVYKRNPKLLGALEKTAVIVALFRNPFLNKVTIGYACGFRLRVCSKRVAVVFHNQPLQIGRTALKLVATNHFSKRLLLVVQRGRRKGLLELSLVGYQGLGNDGGPKAVGNDSGFRFVRTVGWACLLLDEVRRELLEFLLRVTLVQKGFVAGDQIDRVCLRLVLSGGSLIDKEGDGRNKPKAFQQDIYGKLPTAHGAGLLPPTESCCRRIQRLFELWVLFGSIRQRLVENVLAVQLSDHGTAPVDGGNKLRDLIEIVGVKGSGGKQRVDLACHNFVGHS